MPTDRPPRMGAQPAGRDWRSALEGLGHGAASGSVHEGRADAAADGAGTGGDSATRPLGLQFELRRRIARRSGQWQGPRDEPARRASHVDRLAVRPVTRSARDAWIKGNLTWQNIAYQASAAGVDPAQSRWFAQFALLKGTTPAVYQYGSEWITLDEFESPLLWALLSEATRLGIELVGSDVTPEVVVGAAASVGLDASLAGAGDLVLSPTVTIGDAVGVIEVSRAIAGHGLYRYDFERGVIELAPVADAQLTPAQRSLLDAPGPIHVPAADMPTFLRTHYHRLTRSLPVTSRDGTFVPPPVPQATLVLDARFEPRDVLRLAWSWEYADGRTRAVEASAVVAAVDDPDLDDDLLARVMDELGWVPLDAITLRGVDAAEFAVERMPRLEVLAEQGGLRIDVTGERPDYRELTDPPELRVSTVESFAAKWLAPRLHRFHRDCPDLKVRIETGNEHTDFVRSGIDVAIRYGPGGYTGVSAEKLMDAPVFPVCAPSLPGDGPRPLAVPDDLRHHTLLHDESAAGRPGVPDWAAWLEASGATRADATRGPVFASIYLAQEAAAAGHGVALGVAPLVEEDLHRGRLTRPFDHSLSNAYAFWIVRRHGAGTNPAIEAFCRWLRKEAAGV